EAVDAIVRMDMAAFHDHVVKTGDTICGRAPIMTLLEAVPGSATPVPLKFDTSGRMTGDWTNTVSYQSVVFYLGPNQGPFKGVTFLDGKEQRMLLELARKTLKRHLSGKPLPDPEKDWKEIPKNLARDFGVFVTLKEHGNLRGCIGSILPVEPLYKGVIRNAVNAASHDPRFRPMTMAEEPKVSIEISVLTPPKEVFEARDIRIGRDGVILEHGHSRAVFLPQVAPEQGWDLDTTLTHLALKAGLAGDAWKSDTRFKTFQAQVFHEETMN
ncbi:MAG: AmmeMemoRadiSam system protein A, partial [Deltaproteobacteria bacterium]|nr:AmmeMemoRadiSam system protein A [Deltaproteobacteria bacterium]